MKTWFRNRYFRIILLQGLIAEGLYIAYLLLDSSNDFKSNMQNHITLYALAFIPYIVSYYFLRKYRKSANQTHEARTFFLAAIVVFGLIFRLTLLPTHRSTSDDYYRYLWEGKVLVHGHNPYEVSPNDTSLSYLRDSTIWAHVSYKNYVSNYQPGGQMVFALGYIIGGESMYGLKIVYLLCDALLFFALVKLMRKRNLPDYYLLIYAWLPLPLFEYYVNAHLDIAALPFFVLAILYAAENKYWRGALVFSVSLLIKFYAVFALPFLIKKLNLKLKIGYVAAIAILVALSYLPFFNDRHSVFETLIIYLRRWEFNGSVYKIFVSLFQDTMRARMVCTGLFIAFGLLVFFKGKDIVKSTYWAYLLFVIFGTTIYPWYLGWLAVLHPFGELGAVGALFFMVNLSNFTPFGDVWVEQTWVVALEYIVVFGFLCHDGWQIYRKRNNNKLDKK